MTMKLESCYYLYDADGQQERCTHAQDLYLHCGQENADVSKSAAGNELTMRQRQRLQQSLDLLLITTSSALGYSNTSLFVVVNPMIFRTIGVLFLGISYFRVSLVQLAPLGPRRGLYNLTILEPHTPHSGSNTTTASGSGSGGSFHEDSSEEVIARIRGSNGRLLSTFGIQQVMRDRVPVTTNADIPPCAPKYTIDSNSSELMNFFGLVRIQARDDLPAGTVAGVLPYRNISAFRLGPTASISQLGAADNSFANRKVTSLLICEAVHPELRGTFTVSDMIPFFLSNDNGPISALSLDCPSESSMDSFTSVTLDQCESGINWFAVGNATSITHANDVGIICGRNLLSSMPSINFTIHFLSIPFFTNTSSLSNMTVPLNVTELFEIIEQSFSIPAGRVGILSEGWQALPGGFFTSYAIMFAILEDRDVKSESFTKNDLQLILMHINPSMFCRVVGCENLLSSLAENGGLQFSKSDFVDPTLPDGSAPLVTGRSCPNHPSTATRTLSIAVPPTHRPSTNNPSSPAPTTIAPSTPVVLIISVASNAIQTAASLQGILARALNASSADILVDSTPQPSSNMTVTAYSVTFSNSMLASTASVLVKAGTLPGVVSAASPSNSAGQGNTGGGSSTPIGAIVGGLVAAVAVIGAFSCVLYRRHQEGKITTGAYDDDAVMLSNINTDSLLTFDERLTANPIKV